MTRGVSQRKTRKIPQRTCVGCRLVKSKWDLIRIVRTPDGNVEIDPTSKLSGRGAYICPDPECFDSAVKGKRLDKALGVTISDEIINKLSDALIRWGKS
ncbi:MAG: YlxR family protein [Firmicutes bacterium]|nr:YlxR family protein [Bacillota bacterium]